MTEYDNHITNTDNPHSVNKTHIGLDNVQNIKNNLVGSTYPTTDDDRDSGYSVGSRWVDVDQNKEYVCVNATLTDAVWKETTYDGAGTVDGGSTLGDGVGVFKQKSGSNMEFKGITGGTGVDVIGDTTTITVAFDESTIDHINLLNSGINTHEQIDSHIMDTTLHYSQGAIDHNRIQHNGTNTHDQIDSHLADTSHHFTKESIDHRNLQNVGTNTHAQIDSHIVDSTVHFTKASISHADLFDVGTKTHSQIDSHIADQTLHFTQASIDHSDILNVGTNTHVQIDSHVANSTIHYTEDSIDHDNILGHGSNTHSQIDTHISDIAKHRIINDSDTSTTELWSASNISTQLDTKAQSSHTHTASEVTDFNTIVDSRINLQKGTNDGLATLNSFGKILSDQLPNIAITNVSVVPDIEARDALTPVVGDVAKVIGVGSYIYDGILWIDIQESSDVTSVNGKTGTVTLTTADISEETKLYYTEDRVSANSNVVANTAHGTLTNNPHSVTKTQIGLGNVYNLKMNLGANRAPTSTDDNESGYSIGSRWIDTSNDREYVCFDAATGVAVWSDTTQVSRHAVHGEGSFYHTNEETVNALTKINSGSSKVSVADDIENNEVDIDIVESNINHQNLYGAGTISHAQIDSHVNDGTIHFTKASVDHNNIQNNGSNTHAQIDAHIADPSLHRIMDDSSITNTNLWSGSKISTELATKISYSETNLINIENGQPGSSNHVSLQMTKSHNGNDDFNLGIDSDPVKVLFTSQGGIYRQATVFSADTTGSTATIFGVSSSSDSGSTWNPQFVITQEGNIGFGKTAPAQALDIVGSMAITGTVDGRDIAVDGNTLDSHIANSTLHFTEANIDHINILNNGTNTHAQIDTHIASTGNPHSVTIDQVTPSTTKGDILVENGSNVVGFGVGSNGNVLTADPSTSSGLKWAPITFPSAEYFMAYNTAPLNLTSMWQDLTWDMTEKSDTVYTLNVGNTEVVVKQTGWYEIHVDVSTEKYRGGTESFSEIRMMHNNNYIGGTKALMCNMTSGYGVCSCHINIVKQLENGDKVKVQAIMIGDNVRTYNEGCRIMFRSI